MKGEATDKRSPIIGGALILTIGFLVLFVALLSVGKLPEGCTSGLWLIDRLSCLEPNALGDTFAGAFAPVAFVWLVAAVLLQRAELRAQRQELSLTRQEFKLTRQEVTAQRTAMEEQVEESRRNVQFVEEQTAILKEERNRENQKAVKSRISNLASIVLEQLYQTVFEPIARPSEIIESENSKGKLPLMVRPGQRVGDFETILSFARGIEKELRWFAGATKDVAVVIELAPESFGSLQRNVEKIDELRAFASEELDDRLEYLEWWRVSHSLETLHDYLAERDQIWSERLEEWRAETP